MKNINEQESEENIKGHLVNFLRDTYYNPTHLIATKGRADLAIHLDNNASAPVGVLFEVKRPSNKTEMITKENLNARSMHELILYFLQERLNHKNNSLTHLVITNVYEWFLFDATVFEKVFKENTQLQKAFKEWESGQKTSSKTDLFYNEIAKPFLDSLDKDISFTYVDIREYIPYLEGKKQNDVKLIPLFKFFSPVNLLKLPFSNDSNSLDAGFYKELLHIIGLEEVKDKGKKVIQRLPTEKRNEGSMLENAINILQTEDALRKVPKQFLFGETIEEKIFSLGLELCITWVNRILFLKLLEAQLIKYHQGDSKYRFLNIQTINDYDELYKLFFQVLAKEPKERTALIQKKYTHIPYLNSSLFEISELEDISIKVNALDDNLYIDLYSQSVLTKYHPKGNKVQPINTLHYFLNFLEAYDFASVGKEEVQEENKTIINAAVLGLVFEKINGYKDGSIYTPGAVTMFLCKETIRKAVVQKFNETYLWKCQNIDDLKNHLSDKKNSSDILEFNKVLDSVKIADPAVGSGHFLVSSLNELIAIKAELGILADELGHRLNDVDVSIANDELVVSYHRTQDFFEYSVNTDANGKHRIAPEIQRIQETLFNEKRKLIEGSLFGVDINPNSVKICQLRLWIELLKHAYYRNEENFKELETLPNIDINIKQGNSLLSKFKLSEDLSEVFKKQKFGVLDYQLAVSTYKEAPNKLAKVELLNFIKSIKEQFKDTVSRRDPKRKRLSELRGQLSLAQNNFDLFGKKQSEDQMEQEVAKLNKQIEKFENEIIEIENNAVYRSAFEWRYEFPEAWNDKGEFEGFEVIIGNPPYIQLQKMGADADVLQLGGFKTFARTGDIYCLFYEQAIRLLKPNYYFGYITSNKWMRANYGVATRKFFLEESNPLLLIDFGGYQVFESATVDTNILISQKADYSGSTQTCLIGKGLDSLEKMSDFIRHAITVQDGFNSERGWVILTEIEARIKRKIEANGIPLKDWDINIYRGILTGYNEAFIIDEETKKDLQAKSGSADLSEIIRPILLGRNIKRFSYKWDGLWLINTHNGIKGAMQRIDIENNYPAVYDYLKQFLPQIELRCDQGDHWTNLRNCAYLEDFNKPKIAWGNLALKGQFAFIEEPMMINAPSPFFATDNIYILALLNSSLADFYIKQLGVTRNGGYFEYKPMYVEQFPIPLVSSEIQEKFIRKVFELREKHVIKNKVENELNQMVFDLYELTIQEKETIGFVEI
uniref:type IIG restriction enzyme/methyltransferase n=1 Tax=Pedobacter psychrophilus TaxID=1826909 RepID=UPI0012FD9C61|nr:Eco57I restriction-modification methylase domain-containing protein [Pedobacter psychrophilus]